MRGGWRLAPPFELIGIPSSAGAHLPGQEQAPDLLRRADLVEQPDARGCAVVDHGDLPGLGSALTVSIGIRKTYRRCRPPVWLG